MYTLETGGRSTLIFSLAQYGFVFSEPEKSAYMLSYRTLRFTENSNVNIF